MEQLADRTAAIDEASPSGAATARLPARRRVTGLARRTVFWIALIDLALIVAFGLLSKNHVYLTLGNFQNVSLNASQIVLLATGEAFLLGAGMFDISLGATLVLASVVGGRVLVALGGTSVQTSSGLYPHLAVGLIAAVLACLAAGALVGLVNGLVVTRLKVNSLIATLAMLGIATGTADLLAGGSDVTNVPPSLQSDFGSANFLGVVPDPVLLTAAIVAVLWWVLAKSRFGLRTLAIGSARVAATRAGIKVERHECTLFVMVGTLAGLAGFLDLARFATTNISGHTTDALAAIAGAVIGGTSLFGGIASIGGAVIGALLAVLLQTGLVIMNLQAFWQEIVVGIVLILAVHFDTRRRGRP
jgi:ribose transport system permease protein